MKNIILYAKKRFFKTAFEYYSFYLNTLFFILDLMPPFVRTMFFKLCFKKYGKNILIDYKTFFRYMKNIEIADNVSINRGCEFFTSANLGTKICLAENVVISPNVKFYGAGHDYKMLYLPDTSGDIIIESNVWICANSIILQGVKIGEGSIVSANSVVTKSIPPYTIVAGIPAKIIKQRELLNE